MTRLLVSVGYVEELPIVYKYRQHIDILDLKNVKSTESLGCPEYNLIEEALHNKFTSLSIPLGDVEKPYTSILTLAELIDKLDIDFIKVGICMNDREQIIWFLRELKHRITSSCLVVTGFGDYNNLGYIDPLKLLDICRMLDIKIFMIDTKIKDGRSIVEKYGIDNIMKIRDACKQQGIMFSLAGGLKISELSDIIREVRPDIVGLRSALCDKRSHIMSEARLLEVIRIFKDLSRPNVVYQHHCGTI
ncbi:MAG: hypothetical protein GXO23_01845 [Crenarchaeota archaeon]|nr:hypothetical protein [Thermoproteota archaeon]